MKTPLSRLDGNFDGIANKFDENIYGTTKGKLRHQLLVQCLSSYINSSPLSVLDVGGGTGMMSAEFAKHGHHVTIADISQEALVIAKQRLKDFPNTVFINCDIGELTGRYDFIICHAVLEWLNEPLSVLLYLHSLLRPQGIMSLSFFNHDAKVFNNLLYGNFDYVEKGLPSKNTVRLNPHNAQSPRKVIDFIQKSSLYNIIESRGIRCFHDYMLDKSKIDPLYQQLFAMEIKYGGSEPYKWLGKYFHIMLQAR
jgi:S-adenosylmethionine-dependent methyltransferase